MSSSSSRILILHVESTCSINSYNIHTRQITPHCLQPSQRSDQFFLQLQSIFNLKQVKAISFSLMGIEYPTTKKQYEYLCECRKFCQQNGIFSYFPSYLHEQCAVISQTKTMVKEGEKIMIFLLDYPNVPPIGVNLIRKKDCYEIVKHTCSKKPPFTQEWAEDMFGTLKPTKIIFDQGPGTTDTQKAQCFFQSYNPVTINIDEYKLHIMESVGNKTLLLMDKKSSPYDVAHTCWCIYEVRFDGNSLIKTSNIQVLPFEKSVTFNVEPTKRVSLYCNCNYGKRTPELFEEIKLSNFKCKKVTVTLKIDINSFYDFKVEPFVEAAEKKVEMVKDIVVDKSADGKKACESGADKNLTTVDEKLLVPEKARMIFEKQNFTVSYFADGNEHSIRDSDGLYKIPIYISFTEKKPIIGKAAMDAYAEKPKFVIFDLIKLGSISNTDIENPKWGFTLSKENDSIFIKMDTVDGERKSTVEFLMALILKNGKDQIKKEYGKKMKDIEIGFAGFIPNEILKKNFSEAGKLLNLNVVFV